MSELELRHLRVIRAVADAGSLSKAAVRLGVSQPALTAQLQRLERRIGGLLFARTGTGVVPTDLGDYVLAAARVLLDEVDELMAGVRARTQAATLSGQVRVGGPPGPIVPLLATAIADRLGGAEASIDIDMHPAELVRKVLDRKVDFAFLEENPGFRTPLPPGLLSRVVLRVPLFVAIAEDHEFAGRREIALAELAGANWVMPPVAEGTEQLAFTRACAAAGFTPTIKHQLSDSTTIRTLVQNGSVTLAKPVARENGGVVIRALEGAPLRQEMVLVWHEESAFTGAADHGPDALLHAFGQLTDTNPLFARWWAEFGPPESR
ncbi:LysR family transcriptional regulator [Actinokineospora auranticolor]|uniref:DNA-binding transcriptional LysR family regulator n=1 Tax=Actinokineospora auranticolor TaxID=155976 RepID=A0A2S6H0N4_9PSEU|nr:LysR family transcriptional regulator [Actinokineospora auranticolor]PPK71033.1 DNA-binding transcriptional LysR family regulator [Actinokineospora auranticolor]